MKEDLLFNELERMSQDSKGMLMMCAFPDCRKIQVKFGDEIYWLPREENPEMYDRVLENYKRRDDLVKNSEDKSLDDLALTHGYCPICYERELKKLEE